MSVYNHCLKSMNNQTQYTIPERMFVQQIENECSAMEPMQVVDFLVKNNLLSATKCKAYVAKNRVKQLIAQGYPTVESMRMVADELACSYESVRKFFYYNYK